MRINVAYGADENFTWHTYVSLFSILKNMKDNDILYCYFLTNTPNKNISIIKELEKKFKNFKLNIISINNISLDKIQTSKDLVYINTATYYRFGIDLIEKVEKLIYLDSDIIVNSNISELFQENIENKTVGVCSDMPKDYIASYIDKIGIKRKKYFNAGVLLINLNRWKDQQISKKCLNLLRKGVYKFNDQDVLNITLQDDCKWLPGNYNVQVGYSPLYFGKFKYLGFEKEYYQNAIKDPKIIHYTGRGKPRKLLQSPPFRDVYCKVFWQSLSINVLKHGRFLRECLVIFLHNIEDLLLSDIRQKKIRRKILSLYNNLTGKNF